MDIIAGYVKTIALFMIFGAFIEIIAPSGSLKKYLRLILSLTLIALLLEPIGALLNASSFESLFLRQKSVTDGITPISREEYEREQADMVIAEYKKGLEAQVKQVVKTQTGIEAEQIKVVVNEDYASEGFSEILGVHITAVPPKTEESGAIRSALLGNADARPSSDDINKAIEQNIKKCISDFYILDSSNIHITVQEEQP